MFASARRDLTAWIDIELRWYVKDYINDGDYATLRKHLIDIAEAHAINVVRLRKQAVAKDGQRKLRPQQTKARAAGKNKPTHRSTSLPRGEHA